MKGVVKNVSNFLIEDEWLFIIEDSDHAEYFIMAEPFYKKNSLKTPVTKRELDSLKENSKIDFEYKIINGKNIVTGLKW